MPHPDLPLVAGTVSTVLFMVSYLPMLAKAIRTRDLTSYSVGYLLIANVGNAVHTVYVVSLPVGPIWFLHTFYLLSTALMLFWYWSYGGSRTSRDRARTGAQTASAAGSRTPAPS